MVFDGNGVRRHYHLFVSKKYQEVLTKNEGLTCVKDISNYSLDNIYKQP
ncbi:hypothetical protein CRYPD_1370 [uncultured Candidatus Thioglobus sp.]|nr:hypothetical protein CRYPD_1370 [uncultured Candidatus Thioglobus sp.]